MLFRDTLGPSWASDFTRLDGLEQETRARVDSALAALGFSHAGDLVAKAQRDVVARAYRAPDGLAYGVLPGKRTMYLGFEFYSRLADGSVLTTTTNGSVGSRPEFRSYARTFPGLEPPALWAKHREGLDRFRDRKGTAPVPLGPGPADVARELDRALARREGRNQWVRVVAVPPGEAPESVRRAWVGVALPVAGTTEDDAVSPTARGVLTGREAPETGRGYTVRVADALRELGRHAPDAAAWWHAHAPLALEPGKLFAFPGGVCEAVEGPGPAPA